MAKRDITKWKDRYSADVAFRDKEKKRWAKAVRVIDGDHWGGITTTYDDNITFNFTSTILDTIRDSVYFKNPQFIFDALHSDFDDIAKFLNEVFPVILNKILYKQMTKLCVDDALALGLAYKYNGYALEGDTTNDAIKEDEVFSIWVPHDSIAIEKGAHGLWDANYVTMEVARGFDEVKNHPAYNIPSSFKTSDEGSSEGQPYRDQQIKLIHLFDRGEGRHQIFTMENRSFIYDGEWPLGQDCNYFPINRLVLRNNKLYPKGVVDQIVQLNEEFNKMESMKVTHAKRFNRKYHVKGGTLGKQNRAALESGYDGAIVETDEDISINPIQDADLNPAVYAAAIECYEYMKLLARVGEYRMGAQPKSETTATEAMLIEGGTNLGIEYIRDTISDFCERDAQCLIALMKENYDKEKMFNISGQMQAISSDILAGAKFNIAVDCEGSAPPERVEERNEAISLLEMFQNNPFVDPLKPIQNVLKTFKTVKDASAWLNSPTTLQAISQALGDNGPEANMSAIKSYLSSGSSQIVKPASKWSK